MKVLLEQDYVGQWTAIDDDTYDGPGSPIGQGKTPHEAEMDLMDKLIDRDEAWNNARREPDPDILREIKEENAAILREGNDSDEP